MSKIKKLKCFKQVVRILGKDEAKKELNEVRKDQKIASKSRLAGAFTWSDTPQGHEFWSRIAIGKSPIRSVRDWACFEELAEVLGEDAAEQELEAVRAGVSDFNVDLDLNSAFIWSDTPQGQEYWESVMNIKECLDYMVEPKDSMNSYKKKLDTIFTPDPVNHPPHYTEHPSGIECIQVTEHMGFNLGNATKYIWRCDLKKDAIEDLKKAAWYINREIDRRTKSVEE